MINIIKKKKIQLFSREKIKKYYFVNLKFNQSKIQMTVNISSLN